MAELVILSVIIKNKSYKTHAKKNWVGDHVMNNFFGHFFCNQSTLGWWGWHKLIQFVYIYNTARLVDTFIL